MKSKTKKIIVHILGSFIFLSLPVIFSPDVDQPFDMWKIPGFQRHFFVYVILLGFFYFNHYFLLPEFYFRNRYLPFGIILLACYCIFIFTPSLFIPENFDPGGPLSNFRPPPPRRDFFGSRLLHKIERESLQFFLVLGVSMMIKINQRLKLAEKAKLNAELSYLKAQVNPHFLFNTLNSIYSLAIEKSDYTATAVVKLSGMMRYVITEASKEFVSLEKEINYLADYIELQKIRLGNTVQLSYSVSGSPLGKKIAPLILIPFVENAFKHGVNPEQDSTINISIDIKESDLSLKVGNNKVSARPGINEQSGLGIENTRGRLQMIYPARHKLEIAEDEKSFSIILKLNLD
jgi:hypothetical protein